MLHWKIRPRSTSGLCLRAKGRCLHNSQLSKPFTRDETDESPNPPHPRPRCPLPNPRHHNPIRLQHACRSHHVVAQKDARDISKARTLLCSQFPAMRTDTLETVLGHAFL
ncbi:uncharacterized protein PADG_06578 [Paracoccidioides brasiliensis Pb18]|uniref:Uncharacterized protein n=1 Tax=Paracoccidioides brasiliensis (strain Pb18) TaxID=502780 RepID=C1GH42_PARBD|nr:uncharacterized protein PADG_06578 [Paracoccidioides brasiliensis Pb18]EEH50499.2 hypothetical protein PADG_06578 [Paracoccidioides brasiliensis Pb18]